ncbi:hypothetical protein HK105_203485 [Polyrhizophydium stewartii]|uniref:DAGKc domain-containing protein n=1 Tax=Polyrhizophydium stewartii TaxID=2732419 RepID=A0ABR4NC02_9FUNG
MAQPRYISLLLDHVVGAAHVWEGAQPLAKRGFCQPDTGFLGVLDAVSDTPTGFWMVFAFDILKDKKGDVVKPALRQIKFRAASPEAAQDAVDAITDALYPDRRTKKILFIVNPFGGTKYAKVCYNHIIFPMMRMAGLHEHHEMIGKLRRKYKCAITVSGDGVFHELVNGLLLRPDWETARQLPIGIVGSGSANALSRNLDINFRELAVLAALKARSRPMDVFSYTQNGVRMFSHLLVMFAFLGDLDIESDRYRFMGSTRFTIAAIVRLIKFRSYKTRLYMLTADKASRFRLDNTNTGAGGYGPPSLYTSPSACNYTSWPLQVDSYVQFFVATNLPWISSEFIAAPMARMDDGAISVLWAEELSRMQTLGVVLDQESGAHMTFEAIRHARVVAYVLEPDTYVYNRKAAGPPRLETKTSDPSVAEPAQIPAGSGRAVTPPANRKRAGIMDVSGEEVMYGPMVVEVHPRMINIVVPPWLDIGRWERGFRERFGAKVQPERF